jgi:exopolysaccharide biosynthesis polyprenyl glycosylphosphotransferase
MSSGGTGTAAARAASAATAVGAVNAQAVRSLEGREATQEPSSGPYESRARARPQSATSHIKSGVWIQVAYAVIDLAFVMANGVAAYFLSHPAAGMSHVMDSAYKEVVTHQPLSGYGGFLILYAGLILLFCQGQDLYRTPRKRTVTDESAAVVKAVTFATLLIVAFIYLTGVNIVGRETVAIEFVANAIALSVWRYAKRRVVIHRVEQGIGARNALIIGAGRVGQELARQLEEDKLLGYRFRGFLDSNSARGWKLLGTVEDLASVAKAEFVDDIFITIPSERELVKRITLEARSQGINVKIVPDLLDGLAWNVPMGQVGDFPVMDVRWKAIPMFGLFCKRVLDVTVSSVTLIAAAPLLAALAIWIKLDSPGVAIYKSRRVGRKGRAFDCYKLRTMVENADDLKDGLRHLNERSGPVFKIEHDPRITRAGQWLRRHSLDELPQVWNVLKGDMSLVGPRPHPLDDYSRYSLDQLRRLEMRPGLTGLWQVTARQDPSFERNLALDLNYIENWSFLQDLKLIAQTVPAVWQGEGQ